MNSSQIENQIIQNSKGLPVDILQEILDFIEFLKTKKAGIVPDSIQTGLSKLNASEAAHLEEEFADYRNYLSARMKAMDGFTIDTMAIILWMEKRKMPQKIKSIFIKAEKNEAVLSIPAMVLAEIGYLSEKGKIEITLQDAMAYITKHNIRVHNIDIELIKNAFEINDIPELHDRLIAASGKVHGYPVITNDPKIIASEFVSTVWN